MRHRPGALLILWICCDFHDRLDHELHHHLWKILPRDERYHAVL